MPDVMITATLLTVVCILFLLAAYRKYLYRKRREGEPPILPGNFIWGNAKEFGENAVGFLQESRKKFGDIFTIKLLNQHLTIVMDPHSCQAMAKEKKFDFDPIQRQVNYNVFSFVLRDAHQLLKETVRTVNGKQLKTGMGHFDRHLHEAIDKLHQDEENNRIGLEDASRKMSLRDVTSQTLFYSIFTTIFGKDPDDNFRPLEMHSNFDTFHKYFNYLWLGLPIKLFPQAQKALAYLVRQAPSDKLLERSDLSDYMRLTIQFMRERGQSEADIVGHSLVFLHVNYNTFRLTYWCMYNMMAYPAACNALRQEIDDMVEAKRDQESSNEDQSVTFTIHEVENMPVLDSVIKETMRLTNGAFMVRYITDDCDFTLSNGETYTCRQGDRVAFYPPALHKDPEVFENPLEFKYDRFVDTEFYENDQVLKSPVMGFGTLCPGKRYAMVQAKWYLAVMMYTFDFSLAEGESTYCDNRYHGHEILPPVHDVSIHFKDRDVHAPKLRLV